MYATPRHGEPPSFHSAEGTIQRVDYPRRKLTVTAAGQTVDLEVPAECLLSFDGRLATFRCFQALDDVRAVYVNQDGKHIAQAIFVWAAQAASFGG